MKNSTVVTLVLSLLIGAALSRAEVTVVAGKVSASTGLSASSIGGTTVTWTTPQTFTRPISASSAAFRSSDAASQATDFGSATAGILGVPIAGFAYLRSGNGGVTSTATVNIGGQFGDIFLNGDNFILVNSQLATSSAGARVAYQGRVFSGSSAVPAATLSGQAIEFRMSGHTGAAFTSSRAQIQMTADSTWTGSSQPTRIGFFSTNMSGPPVERLRITPAGAVGISTGAPAALLDINGTFAAGSGATKTTIATGGALAVTGTVSVNNGANIIYHCVGSTAGTFDGNIARGNGNAGACAGGTWTATSLRVD